MLRDRTNRVPESDALRQTGQLGPLLLGELILWCLDGLRIPHLESLDDHGLLLIVPATKAWDLAPKLGDLMERLTDADLARTRSWYSHQPEVLLLGLEYFRHALNVPPQDAAVAFLVT